MMGGAVTHVLHVQEIPKLFTSCMGKTIIRMLGKTAIHSLDTSLPPSLQIYGHVQQIANTLYIIL